MHDFCYMLLACDDFLESLQHTLSSPCAEDLVRVHMANFLKKRSRPPLPANSDVGCCPSQPILPWLWLKVFWYFSLRTSFAKVALSSGFKIGMSPGFWTSSICDYFSFCSSFTRFLSEYASLLLPTSGWRVGSTVIYLFSGSQYPDGLSSIRSTSRIYYPFLE